MKKKPECKCDMCIYNTASCRDASCEYCHPDGVPEVKQCDCRQCRCKYCREREAWMDLGK